MTRYRSKSTRRLGALSGAVALLFAGMQASAQDVKEPFGDFEQKEIITANQGSYSFSALPSVSSGGVYKLGFEAVTQYDAAGFSRNFIPPDTMGAVGRAQYMAVTNGAYGIFDKTSGTRLSAVSDLSFWTGLGMTGANGDTRIMYNADASRWVMVAFGSNTANLQIAVSDTDNALGTWKATSFTGYAGLGFGATADYPTLALDKNAVYIGTNNFAPATSGGANNYQGTTLNVIPITSLFNTVAPTTTNLKQFVTGYVSGGSSNLDSGYAIQGVNSKATGTSGKVVAASAFVDDYMAYKVNGLTTTSAVGATQGAAVYQGFTDATAPGAARQPSVAIAANQRIVDASDGRVSSSAYEVNGRIYMVESVKVGAVDEARIRWTVLDSNTLAVLAKGDLGAAGYDYYQASIGVNDAGKVVIGYNRSGLDAATGKISFMAQAFGTALDGSLVAVSGEILLKESLTDDYHNGSTFGAASAGRQRWGDYSQVSVDPDNPNNFYLIGEFAREYNNAAGGHPTGTGGSRWGTWVAQLDVSAVPETSTYMMMALGLCAVSFISRRSKAARGA